MATTRQADATPQTPRRGLRWVLMGATGLTFVGLMVAGTAALHMRANAEVSPAANPPVTVNTQA